MRLRLASHLRAMIGVQLLSTAVMLGLAAVARPARHGLGRGRLGHRPPRRRRRRVRREPHRRPLRDDRAAAPTSCREPVEASMTGAPACRNLAARARSWALLRVTLRAAVAGRPAVALGRGLGVPRDRGQRARGRPRAAPAVRRPGRLAARRPRAAPPRCAPWPSEGMRAGAARRACAGSGAYLRAEAVFFTHGLYGSPRPSPRKPIVNLWHGDGPKDIRPEQRRRRR